MKTGLPICQDKEYDHWNINQFDWDGKQSLDRISLDQNCVLSLDRNYVNHLIEFFDTFHLIEICNNDFDQTPKN